MNRKEENGLSRSAGPVVPARFVVTEEKPRRVGQGSHGHDHGEAAPQIELVQENGVVRAINITCTCGERMRVNCGY